MLWSPLGFRWALDFFIPPSLQTFPLHYWSYLSLLGVTPRISQDERSSVMAQESTPSVSMMMAEEHRSRVKRTSFKTIKKKSVSEQQQPDLQCDLQHVSTFPCFNNLSATSNLQVRVNPSIVKHGTKEQVERRERSCSALDWQDELHISSALHIRQQLLNPPLVATIPITPVSLTLLVPLILTHFCSSWAFYFCMALGLFLVPITSLIVLI